ncbi:MAG: polymer-forming cytoskeletal protein [Deltaproteobacteria bacterium]|nr:polymer-forming cytoskeletal protein [Deltaproteobacteria bacterium]
MPTLPGAGTPPAPVPAWVGDRIARGGDVLVRAGERVRDAVALGGDVRVEGEVTGDAVATGGDVRVVSGGNVFGDATSMGGDVVVESGGTVGGSTVSVGGEVRLEPGAAAHGSSYRTDRPGVQLFRGDVDSAGTTRWLSDALGRGARYALLLLLALVLAGAAPDRFAALQRTLVKQPARAVASGVLGALGAAIAMLVLAVTIIGLPAAIVVALLVVACVYVGLAASASVIGAIVPIAKLRDRPVLQTATGVALLFVVSFVPFVGGLVVAFAALIGGGAVVATRFSTRAPGD